MRTGAADALVLRRDGSPMPRLATWLDGRFAALAVDGKLAFDARLCLEEAVQNVVMHGGPGATIRVWVDRSGDGLEALVEDDGPEFDVTVQPRRVLPALLADATPGGLGITLMRSFATSLRFCRVGGLNRLALTFS